MLLRLLARSAARHGDHAKDARATVAHRSRLTALLGALRLSPRDPFSAVYCGIASYAQFLGCNYDEAMRFAREAVRQRDDFVGAHRVLTAAAGMAGQGDVAKSSLQELRRAQPNISLAWIASQMPIKLDADRQRYLEGFRRAGLN